eukprot:6857286-Alexandrium_andersonii.AAC.1
MNDRKSVAQLNAVVDRIVRCSRASLLDGRESWEETSQLCVANKGQQWQLRRRQGAARATGPDG